MAWLRRNGNGDFYFRMRRGVSWTTHALTSHGAERVKKAGVDIGQPIHYGLRQLLDQNLECTPLCGDYKGQQQFETDGFQQVSLSPHPKPKWIKKPKATADQKQRVFDFDAWALDEAA